MTLKDRLIKDNSYLEEWLKKMAISELDRKLFSHNFLYYHKALAVDNVNDKLFISVKNNFYISSLIEEFGINNFNNRSLDYYGLLEIFSPIFSDNEALIQRFAKLRYDAYGKMPDMDFEVSRGRSPIWCNTVQFFMENNTEGVERNLNIIELKILNKVSKNDGLIDDYHFYKALLDSDKGKMEEILAKLLSPKIHKKRHEDLMLKQYFSFIGTGLAKLAWRKGIEVEVNSPFVPKELLPIVPNELYDIPYDFLK